MEKEIQEDNNIAMKKKRISTVYLVIVIILSIVLFITIFCTVNYFFYHKKIAIQFENTEEKVQKYEYLFDNYNLIESNTIFSGAADLNDKENARLFTAFSIFYNSEFYIITAGHSVEFEGIKYENFKLRKQGKEDWLYPELLYYKNDFANDDDFAIFYHEGINRGLYPAYEDKTPEFIIGDSIIKLYNDDTNAAYGESGSPVLNSKCRVVGVLIKDTCEYTQIDKVLDAIDSLKQ